jgi:hypothetical protein
MDAVTKTVSRRLLDLFPTSDICIGGSYALKKALPKEKAELITVGDMDYYLKLNITTYAFKELLEKIVFKDADYVYILEQDQSSPNRRKYKIPFIQKRIVVKTVYGSEVRVFEFILFKEASIRKGFFHKFIQACQSSVLSTTLLVINFSDAGFFIETTSEFKRVLNFKDTGSVPVISININEDCCTDEHLSKLLLRCHTLGIRANTADLGPYEVAALLEPSAVDPFLY